MPFFSMLLLYAGMFVLSELLKPKPKLENARAAQFEDFELPTATEARVIPVVFGTVKVTGPNVTWYGDLDQIAITTSVKTGMFSGKKTVIQGYRYALGIQFSICRGPIDEILRVWVDDKELLNGNFNVPQTIDIDEPKFFGGNTLGQGGLIGPLTLRLGSETQAIVPYLTPFQNEGGDTVAYVGTAYAVFEQGEVGTRTNLAPWAFEVRRIPTGLSTTNHIVNGFDANPAHVIFEMLTNDEWGLGLPSGDIDLVNFQAAADTLFAEGNGFSTSLNNSIEAFDLVQQLETQIDGVVYTDPQNGLWKIKLVRDDYVFANLFQIDESNVALYGEYARASWDDTSNEVKISFTDRNLDYFKTSAVVQDLANFRLQGNVAKPTSLEMRGVADATLASSLVTRELRQVSIPLAKANVTMDRSAWDVILGQAIRYSNPNVPVTDLVMRITKINLGEMTDNKIQLELIEDVFFATSGIFADPPATGWVVPVDSLVAIPADESIIIEAPKAIVDRDPEQPGVVNRIWAAARNQGDGAVDYTINTREGIDPFVDSGDSVSFILIGELAANLNKTGFNPTTQVDIVPTPDTQADLLAALLPQTPSDIGQSLANLLLINDEFLAFEDSQIDGGNVQLNQVYRSFMDSVQADHLAGDKVYAMFLGGNVTTDSFTPGDTIDVRLVPESSSDVLAIAAATNVPILMDSRAQRPYPPCRLIVNGTQWPTVNISLDQLKGGGVNNDDKGLEADYRRKDYRTSQEVNAVISDTTGLVGAFPADDNTVYRTSLYDTTGGGNTFLFSTAYNTGEATVFGSRTTILRFTNGIVPTSMRMEIETKHTVSSVDFTSFVNLQDDFPTVAGQVTGFFGGVLTNLTVGNLITITVGGVMAVNIATAADSGTLEYRLNGGGFISLITAGLLSGNIVGLVATDTIEFRNNGMVFTTSPYSETYLTFTGVTPSGFAICAQ